MEDSKRIFFIESLEILEEMESALLRLEVSPSDSEALNSVFRAAHTIKGSSGVVGIDRVQDFTHRVENLLDLMRAGKVAVTSEVVGLLLECRDHISQLVNYSVSGSGAVEIIDLEDKRLSDALTVHLSPHIQAAAAAQAAAFVEAPAPEPELPGPCATTENWHISLRFSPEVLRGGMDPIAFLNYLTRLGEIVYIRLLFDSMPPALEMDPEACYLGFEIDLDAKCEKKDIEDVFEFVKEDCSIRILPPRSKVLSYIKLINELPEDPMMLGQMLLKGGALTEKEMEAALALQEAGEGRRFGDILVEEGILEQTVVQAALTKQQSASAASSQQQQQQARAVEATTIRVDIQKLDVLINTVGELVISGANVNMEARRLKDSRLQQSVGVLARLIEEIRDSAMRVRMMPIQDTLGKFHRVVRDICHETGKEIELVIHGGDTELDRTVLEKIKDPLMHLVRNAVDHGIEMPGEREAEGKPGQGTLLINAYQDTGDIIIEISDNGRGIDPRKIERKALERGLIDKRHEMTDEEIQALIFAPGFSTAEVVTNISGRGVGMDVVKRNIEALRGSVDIKSTPGKGTTVSIRLPLTLAIIDGFLVRVGDSHYVVPMDSVVECMELKQAQVEAAHGRDHINLRGSVLPYIKVRELFGESEARTKHRHILVVQHAGRKTGLLVDKLHGEIQTVIKTLGRVYRNIEGISGATILGDGTVALIIDVPTLVRRATSVHERRVEDQ